MYILSLYSIFQCQNVTQSQIEIPTICGNDIIYGRKSFYLAMTQFRVPHVFDGRVMLFSHGIIWRRACDRVWINKLLSIVKKYDVDDLEINQFH